jgi:membrane dipeptidase
MIPVFDGHNDTITRDDHPGFVTGRPAGHLDLPRMYAGGIRAAIFAVFTDSPGDHENHAVITRPDGTRQWPQAEPVDHLTAAAFAARAAGRLLALERDGHIRLARQIGDLDTAAREMDGPPAAVLHLEGAEAIDPGLESLELWYAAGLRSLGPVWSRSNAFGHGVPFIFGSGPDTGPGLTDAGRRLVRRCAERGIAVDLSHLNEAGFWDVAHLDVGPLVASHSGAYALAQASRNLTDDQLDAIGATGGLVGIVYAVAFLREDFADEPDTPLSLIARHAAYVAERIGVKHVGLGSDFDGTMIPASLQDAAGVPRLLEALREVGFTPAEVEAIAWGNWRRVLDAWWR